MAYELLFQLTGMLCCLAASAYLLYRRLFMVGTLLLIAFISQLQLQAYLYFFLPLPAEMGDCWAKTTNVYDCVPLGQKISTLLAQLSYFLIALALTLIAGTARNISSSNALETRSRAE